MGATETHPLALVTGASSGIGRDGRILFTSSIASTLPGTYQAVYNASKSFVQSLFFERANAAMHRRMAEPRSSDPDDTT